MRTKLSNICDVDWGNTNLTKSAYNENGKYLGVSAAGCDGRMDYYDFDEFTPVISAIGANCGRLFLPKEKFVAIKNTITLKPHKEINGKYLYYSLVNNKIPKRGGGQPFISKTDTENYEIECPNINKQIKIVEVFDNLYNLIEKHNTKLLLLDELVKTRFVEMFEDDFKGNTHKLNEYTEVITKGTTPTTLGFSFTDEGINFIKIECISNDYSFIFDKMLHIDEECNKKLKRSILKEGDILYSIAGAIGRTAVVTRDILPANTNQALAIIRLKDDAPLDKKFLNEMLHSDFVEKQSKNNVVAVAQANLSLTDIGNFDIVVPSIKKQKEYFCFVEQIDKSKLIIQKKINKYQELTNKLMDKYFGDFCDN